MRLGIRIRPDLALCLEHLSYNPAIILPWRIKFHITELME
jgi:hypothetical protein